MPIGTSKVGLFGGRVPVPAGCETFNAPGTFTAVDGLEIVSATGVGGAGNPGNAGNAGNPASPTTQNCVSIVGGSSYPVTVNGQVNISWCPQ